MNDDSLPPMPQNETAVDYSRHNPLIAVAAANDYVSGGVVVMRTANGGKSWQSTRVTPQFGGTRDFCSGGDPAVAYSRRDRAFYLSQLCFFRALPFSEIQLYKSVDNGKTWTPGRQAGRVATNFDYADGTVDESIFHDKEFLTVDNHPSSPHYGRIYVTWTKFHILPDGSSDFCPIQLAHTDSVPTTNPLLATFTQTSVVPDAPGAGGLGESANQFSVPKVEPDGTLDVGYALEECNTSLDHGFRFQKSTDGGASFLSAPVHIDKPGQFVDNPDPGDLLPPTAFRAPNTIAFAINERSGAIVFVYTNYLNRASSGGDVTYQVSRDHGLTWSDAKPLSVASGGAPAPNDQFLPLDRRNSVRGLPRHLVRPPPRPGQPQHRHLAGDLGQRRQHVEDLPDLNAVVEPGPRVLHLRRVHRRLQRHRRLRPGRVPGLDRRPQQLHRRDRHR
jgi:hypothetical protein